MAAADAHHDFDKGVRGAAKVFENVFSHRNHKGIGTPRPPSELLTEHDTLNRFLHYFGEGEKSQAVAKFRETFLTPDHTTDIQRASDDPVDYEAKSMMISSRFRQSGKDTFAVKPSAFINFLTGDSGRDVAFSIDAVSTSFYNIFREAEPGGKNSTAYFITARESINDGAGKIDVTAIAAETADTDAYSVRVRSITDAYAGEVIYAATDTTQPFSETFYSIFTITLLPIGLYHSIPAIRVLYSKDDYSEPPDLIVQNAKDTMNTVSSLSKRIATFLRGLRGDDYRPYYTMIQRKRSGDWLQVLACLDRKRFGLDVPIILCTEDIICAAYAIAMGVDVLFTHVWQVENEQQNWVVYFRKKIDAPTMTKAERLAQAIARVPLPDAEIPELLRASYLTVRTAFLRYRDEASADLLRAFGPAAAAVAASRDQAATERTIKAVLSNYARLAWMRASLPLIPAIEEETLTDLHKVSKYESNLSIFKKILKGRAGDVNAAIKAYVDSIVGKARGGPMLETHINNISIFGSFMSMRRSREAGLREHVTGLFAFLFDYLTQAERTELLRVLTLPASHLREDDLKKYTVFLDTAKMFVGKEGNGPRVPNWVLLEEVIAETEAPAAEAPAAEAPAAEAPAAMTGGAHPDPFEFNPSYGCSVILALRYQNKEGREHRVEDLEGRRHSPMTTCILFLNRLVGAMDAIDRKQLADPTYVCNSEFMLRYLSQWLIAILGALPGHDRIKEYKNVECFLLGMVLQLDSDLKGSSDLIDFLTNFKKEVYGVDLIEYRLQEECRRMSPITIRFKYDDAILYTELILAMKELMRHTLDILKEHETGLAGAAEKVVTPVAKVVTPVAKVVTPVAKGEDDRKRITKDLTKMIMGQVKQGLAKAKAAKAKAAKGSAAHAPKGTNTTRGKEHHAQRAVFSNATRRIKAEVRAALHRRGMV